MAVEKLEIIVSGTDKTKKAFGGITQSLGGMAKMAGTAVVAGAGAALAGVGALTVGVGALAKEAATLGPIKESFYGIAEASGVGGDEMLAALGDSANGMIENTELMKTYNLAAMLVGENFANELPAAMSYVGKVSAATGEDMGFMLDSLVRGVGRLSPMILDNLGIQVDLTAAYEAYGKEMGIAEDEMGGFIKGMSKSEQQAALMAQVMDKLGTSTAELPELSDPFQKLATTFTNLKDQVALAIGPVVLPLIEDLASNIGDFVSSDEFAVWIENAVIWIRDSFIPALRNIYIWIRDNIPPAIRALAQFWNTTLKPALQTIAEFIQTKVVPAFIAVKDAFVLVVGFFKEGFQAITAIFQGAQNLLEWDELLGPEEFGGISERFEALYWVVMDAIGGIKDVFTKVKAIWGSDFFGIRSLFEGFTKHIKLVFSLFKAAQEGDWYKFGEILRDIVDNMGETIGKVFSGAMEALKNLAKVGLEKLKGLFINAKNEIKNIDWLELGKAIVRGIGNGIGAMADWLITTARNLARAVLDAMKGFLGIQSPSKVMADEVGKNMGLGILEGLAGSLSGSRVQASISGLPGAASGGLAGGGGITIVYAPAVSTADPEVLEMALAPILDKYNRARGR